MNRFSRISTDEEKRFNALVDQNEKLFAHEEELAESYSGKLVADRLPTPANPCSRMPMLGATPSAPRPTIVIFGDNATRFTRYPHVLLSVDDKPLIQFDQTSPGVVVPIMDVHGRDGRIIARFDKSGFVVGSRLAVIRPDKSTLIVIDDYGDEAVNIHYLNPEAITISGFMFYKGMEIPLTLFPPKIHVHDSCSSGSFGTDINIRTTPK
jgi:hypothetical protein